MHSARGRLKGERIPPPRDGSGDGGLALRRAAFGPDLDPKSQEVLERASRPVRVRSGEVLVAEGAAAPRLLMVAEGLLELSRTLPDGRRQIMGFRFPGEIATLCSEKAPAAITVRALLPGTVTEFDAETVWAHARADPGFACALIDLACAEVLEAREHVMVLGRKKAVERVASFVLDLYWRSAHAAGDQQAVELGMKRLDIADYLGLKTETVSRALAWLKAHGILMLRNRRRAEILDLPALERVAVGASAPERRRPRRVAGGKG